ncbi:MAG: hypothetical protein ACOY90_02585 [Candidatus Zhuqueibacterota bacterium]
MGFSAPIAGAKKNKVPEKPKSRNRKKMKNALANIFRINFIKQSSKMNDRKELRLKKIGNKDMEMVIKICLKIKEKVFHYWVFYRSARFYA